MENRRLSYLPFYALALVPCCWLRGLFARFLRVGTNWEKAAVRSENRSKTASIGASPCSIRPSTLSIRGEAPFCGATDCPVQAPIIRPLTISIKDIHRETARIGRFGDPWL